MPKENIFSGKYEPDRDTCTEANESNVARFRTAMLKLDRIHNDDNEKDLTENIMQLCSRNNKTGEKIDLSADYEFEDAMDWLEKVYNDVDADLMIMAIDQLAERYGYTSDMDAEDLVSETEDKLSNIQKDKITGDNIYNYLLMFDSVYDVLSDMEKKQFYNALLTDIQIYEEEQDKQIIKSIGFKFPVFYDGEFTKRIIRDKEKTVETVVLLSKLDVDKHIDVEIKLDQLDLTSAESKATYAQIKEYVLEKFGLKVSTLYIAQIKKKCGIEMREHYNKSKKDNQAIPQCTPEKEEAIMDALRHFKMIQQKWRVFMRWILKIILFP